ncbi:hypothetical protein CHUAL_005993 [Chamberlinius hualienensis]
MSKYKAIDSQGFFDEEEADDVDDFMFLNHPKQGSGGYFLGNSSSKGSSEVNRQQQLMDEMKEIERRTLESSKRSLGFVHESEQIGISTAENLLRQREQLDNCEKRVTDINSSLRVSQKHLTSIQSIFAGFKSIFSKTTPVDPSPSSSSAEAKPSSASSSTMMNTSTTLGAAMDSVKSQPNFKPAVHPGLKLRGLDDDDDEDEAFLRSKPSNGKVQQQLDENLEDLCMGLSRLKGLAVGLGDEIDEQNDLIDKVMKGAEKADMGIERQNKQMKKILGNK